MQILFLESFYGGSHRDVADSLVRHSRHRIALRTLPARFWKWRMRGAALSFAHETDDPSAFDLIVCTGLMSIPDFRALACSPLPPILLYAHETQLAYPSPAQRESDLHFAFTDLTNMLAADHTAFNSHTHRQAYLDALPGFLRRLPEYRPMWAIDEVERRSSVCYPGIRPAWAAPGAAQPAAREAPLVSRHAPRAAGEDAPPLILWNHRWEFDKQPEAFFAALREVRRRGCSFRLAVLGENFKVVPKEFVAAKEEFADEIVAFGYQSSRRDYEAWLRGAEIVVSTAIQENFGIAVMEAIACGAYPLLPHRLAYPEIIPAELHDCLYADQADLVAKLERLLRAVPAVTAPDSLVQHARSFAWPSRVDAFDALFERAAAGGSP
jgi:glycosyltransferase involved in cell wall biosynthesis